MAKRPAVLPWLLTNGLFCLFWQTPLRRTGSRSVGWNENKGPRPVGLRGGLTPFGYPRLQRSRKRASFFFSLRAKHASETRKCDTYDTEMGEVSFSRLQLLGRAPVSLRRLDWSSMSPRPTLTGSSHFQRLGKVSTRFLPGLRRRVDAMSVYAIGTKSTKGETSADTKLQKNSSTLRTGFTWLPRGIDGLRISALAFPPRKCRATSAHGSKGPPLTPHTSP